MECAVENWITFSCMYGPVPPYLPSNLAVNPYDASIDSRSFSLSVFLLPRFGGWFHLPIRLLAPASHPEITLGVCGAEDRFTP